MSNDSLLIDTIFSPCRKRSCQFTYKPAKIDIIDLWTLFAEGRHQICPFHQCQFFHLQTDLLTHEISWPRFSYVRTHHMFSRILNFFICIFFSWKKLVFSTKITVIMALYNLFWFLNENTLRTDQSKRQNSRKQFRFRRFRIRENMWWTHYRSATSLCPNIKELVIEDQGRDCAEALTRMKVSRKHSIYIRTVSFSYIMVHLVPSRFVWARYQVYCVCCSSQAAHKLV